MNPSILRRISIGKGQFLSLDQITWRDQSGAEHQWESAERNSKTQAVGIVAWLKPSDRLLLVQQFRPPIGHEVIEFPAGLIDPGETPEAAAARELKEETGYVAQDLHVWPLGSSSAGMTSESIYLVSAIIDESRPENQNPKTNFHDQECIVTHLIHRNELFAFMQHSQAQGITFDAKLVAYLLPFYRTVRAEAF